MLVGRPQHRHTGRPVRRVRRARPHSDNRLAVDEILGTVLLRRALPTGSGRIDRVPADRHVGRCFRRQDVARYRRRQRRCVDGIDGDRTGRRLDVTADGLS